MDDDLDLDEELLPEKKLASLDDEEDGEDGDGKKVDDDAWDDEEIM